MSRIVFRNFDLLDPVAGILKSGYGVIVDGNIITEVGKGIVGSKDDTTIDLGGRTLMPGLIDVHQHTAIGGEGLPVAPRMLPSLITAYASRMLKGFLSRGFTTLRDAGGADFGHKQAVELQLFTGPRLFVSGRAISQTGGHGDSRSISDLRDAPFSPHLFPGLGRVADGVTEVRKAVRDELRMGADQIKVMAGGGIGSQADPVDHLQYSVEELEAIVDEAQRFNTYVMAHILTPKGIQRCVQAGVRTIEHGNLLDEETARLMAAANAYLVPTLVVSQVIKEYGRELNFSEASIAKVDDVLAGGTRSLELAAAAGVKMGFGTDCARAPEHQSREFLIRAQVLKPADIIRSATVISAEILRQDGKLGIIKPGAFADLLAVDGNPLEDIKLLASQGDDMSLIMANGNVFKNNIGDHQ
jgi:imidazolonepropionase-like amidohydrolase